MSSRAPPIPPDQRSAPNDKPHIQGDGRSARPNADPNTREQGRHGNLNQNTHHQQDR